MKVKKAFTLVEVIAVIAILSITSVLAYTIFIKAQNVFSKAESESISIDQSRNLLSVLEEDIKLSKSVKAGILNPGDYGLASTVSCKVEIVKGEDTGDVKYLYTFEGSSGKNKIVKYKYISSTGKWTSMATLVDNSNNFNVEAVSNASEVYKITVEIKVASDSNETKVFQTLAARRKL